MMNKSLCFIFALGVTLTISNASTVPIPGEGWCVAKADAPEEKLNAFINEECSGNSRLSLDCTLITPGEPCFEPNTVAAHASYVLDLYYKSQEECVSDLGIIVNKNPSYGECRYP